MLVQVLLVPTGIPLNVGTAVVGLSGGHWLITIIIILSFIVINIICASIEL